MQVNIHIYKGMEHLIIVEDGPVIERFCVVTWKRNVKVLFRPYITVSRFTAYFVCGKEYIEELNQSRTAADMLCDRALKQYNRYYALKRKERLRH